MIQIREELPQDGPAVEHLLDLSFGPGRQRKMSYRYRENVAPIAPLCLVAEHERAALAGVIRYWPVRLDERPALLLGPLAIDPALRGMGVGRALMRESLGRAGVLGHDLVLLVGDPAYYRQFGFAVVPETVVMPGEDPRRLQWLNLVPVDLPEAATVRSIASGGRAGALVEPVQKRLAQCEDVLVAQHGLGHLADARG